MPQSQATNQTIAKSVQINRHAAVDRWLGKSDLLVVKQDRATPLVVLPWRTWRRICRAHGRE